MTEPTLQDVLEGSAFKLKEMEFISRVFGEEMMEAQLATFFSNGKAKIKQPDLSNMSYYEQSTINSFWFSCTEWSTPGFKRQRVLTRYEKYQSIGPPSGFGKPSGWRKWQQEEGLHNDLQIMCLRPAECSWINIRIMHPVFHELIEIIHSGEPQSVDFLFAAELTAFMPEAYFVENARRDEINRVFNKYIANDASAAIGVQCIANKFDTDGTCKEAGTNIEYKNEKGKGDSDPYMQNVGYYVQFWGSDKDIGPRRHCCPWMLVEILGQEIGLSGAVWAGDYPCSQPLSSNVPFLPVPADREARLQQARICMAIRHGFRTLQKFYQEKSKVTTTQIDSQAGFPYMRKCQIGDQEVELKYLDVMRGNARKMLFVAEVVAGQNRVLVKFTDRYNEAAHRVAAKADLAPKLYCVQKVSGLVMVVMDLLEACRGWGIGVEKESENAAKQLKTFLKVFEEHNLVHGDLRSPNVLVDKNDRLRVVDYDWAGTHGIDTYPIAVNPNETWSEGVQAAATVMKEHDKFMVTRLLQNSS